MIVVMKFETSLCRVAIVIMVGFILAVVFAVVRKRVGRGIWIGIMLGVLFHIAISSSGIDGERLLFMLVIDLVLGDVTGGNSCVIEWSHDTLIGGRS